MASAPGIDEMFGKILEAHRDVPPAVALVSILDPSFAVQRSALDAPFCSEILTRLSPKPKGPKPSKHPFSKVSRKLATTMKTFLAPQRQNPAAHRAIVTASLSLLRNSCAASVPSKLAMMAAHSLLQALGTANGNTNPGIALGGEGFPESQIAAFLLDATRVEPPPPPTPPVAVPAHLAVKIIYTFGVGKARGNGLEWGSPDVADCLRGSVRRVADKLREEGDWKVVSELVGHMGTPRGVDEAESVLGMQLGEMIAAAMLVEKWEPALRLVSCAGPGEPRKALARALIPAATLAGAFDVATRLIEENLLQSEFPDFRELKRKAWIQQKKLKLEAVVKRPGWKMAQHMLERGSRNEHELRIWLVEHMCELGNLPAAAQLMDHFNLHNILPPLDPRLVEASARELAAAHLQIPIDTSNIVLVDQWESLRFAQMALATPPVVGGKGGMPPVCCVGLDVENSPTTNRATLLQVATSVNVFLFDLMALGPAVEGRGGRGGKSNKQAQQRTGELARSFDRVIGALLSDPNIVKLGFDFGNDVGHLRKSCPTLRGFQRVTSLLEVGDLSDEVLGKEVTSLSKTCEQWLGKPLDKTECTSKWEKRPLTRDQVMYAALDAHCLVGIFEEMLIERGGKLAGTGPSGDPGGWWKQFVGENIGPNHR